MSVSRRHHYVPKMLSKRFADADGYLWAFDYQEARHGIRPVTPDGVFWEKDLNTQTHPGRPRDVSVEDHFARKLEGPANELLDQISSVIRDGKHPVLDGGARTHLQQFVFYQFKRPPGAMVEITGEPDIDLALSEIRQRKEAELGRPLTAEEIGDTDTEEARREIAANAKVVAVGVPGDVSIQALSNAGLFYLTAAQSAFAIGSRPVRLLGQDHDRNPVNAGEPMVVLPIASDIAVGFGSPQRNGTKISAMFVPSAAQQG